MWRKKRVHARIPARRRLDTANRQRGKGERTAGKSDVTCQHCRECLPLGQISTLIIRKIDCFANSIPNSKQHYTCVNLLFSMTFSQCGVFPFSSSSQSHYLVITVCQFHTQLGEHTLHCLRKWLHNQKVWTNMTSKYKFANREKSFGSQWRRRRRKNCLA